MDKRRKGDKRPVEHDPEASLTLLPAHDEPFRWLPRHGEPSCIGEWLSQQAVRGIAYLPVYTAIVTTLVLLVLVFGVPWMS
jgi:hypothetical protein